MSAQRFLMRTGARPPDPIHVIKRRSKPDRLHDRRGASLEAMRRTIIRDGVPRDFLDHLATALIGRQRL